MRIGFDFDGVLCPTPFGRLAVHAPSPVDPLPEGYERLYESPVRTNLVRLAMEYVRFSWRGSAPDAKAILERLAREHELHVVTGRSARGLPLMKRWLKARGWSECFAGIHMAPSRLRPPQHKLAVARMVGIETHIDDDPRTAYHLAAHGVPVYLLDHAGAHGNEAPPERVTLVRSLREFADRFQGV
jgi:hypothetical protein